MRFWKKNISQQKFKFNFSKNVMWLVKSINIFSLEFEYVNMLFYKENF